MALNFPIIVNGISYELLDERHFPGVKDLIHTSVGPNEPMINACGFAPETRTRILYSPVEKVWKEGVSVVATDVNTNKVVGLRMGTIIERGVPQPDLWCSPAGNSIEARYAQFLEATEGNAFTDLPAAKRVCKFLLVGVHHDYYQRGIAKKMNDIVFELAKRASCDHITVTTTNWKSTKLFVDHFGFTKIRTLGFQEFDAEAFAATSDDNQEATVSYLKL